MISVLHIKNIGPFREATLEFPTEHNLETGEQPVTIITGVNGAGKSIIIDAIRAALGGHEIERNIVAAGEAAGKHYTVRFIDADETQSSDPPVEGTP